MDVIQHDVKRLDRLITDISDASRLDADLARDDSGQVDLSEFLQNIVNASREIKRHKKVDIKLTVNTPKNANESFVVSGHDIRLGQVVNNLIDNACSFVPEVGGKVSIGLGRNKNLVFIIIEDNGPGIQAENLDRVFERFYTDRAEMDGFGQNSGLGLSISRQIIEAHGGKIRAENRRDGQTGARFIVTLPEGKSGSGKTSLMLGLLEYCSLRDLNAFMIADDQVLLTCNQNDLVATAPEVTAGMVELRGYGIIKRNNKPFCKIGLIVEIIEDEKIDRMPQQKYQILETQKLPLIEVPQRHENQATRIVFAWLNENANLQVD